MPYQLSCVSMDDSRFFASGYTKADHRDKTDAERKKKKQKRLLSDD